MFSPSEIAGMRLKNRLVRSATYEGAMSRDGKRTDKMLKLYKDLSEGGAGLIITGNMAVLPEGRAFPKQANIFHDDHIREIEPISRIVHESENGTKIVAQLNHAGRQVLHDNHEAMPSPGDIFFTDSAKMINFIEKEIV